MLRLQSPMLNQLWIADCGMWMQSQIRNSLYQIDRLDFQDLSIKKLKQNNIAATITQVGESIVGGAIASANPILGITLKRGGA